VCILFLFRRQHSFRQSAAVVLGQPILPLQKVRDRLRLNPHLKAPLPAVAAQPPMTKLQIEVRNLSDKPIERASVVVRFVSGHSTMKLGKKIITT